MYCQECGREIKEGVLFCPYCGTKQESDLGMEPMGYDSIKNDYEKDPVDYDSIKSDYEREPVGYDSVKNDYEGEPVGYDSVKNDYGMGADYDFGNGYERKEPASEYVEEERGNTGNNAFCPYCGKTLVDGQCDCVGFQNAQNKGLNGFLNTNSKEPFFIKSYRVDTASFSSFMSSVRDMSGMSEPNSSVGDPFEHDVPIVPDCIEPEENEIVVKQYNIAKLRTRLKFMKAEGRLMITNRRVLFRAAGTSLTGNILQEHQFNVDEIGGIEMHKDHKFSLMNLFGCILLFCLAAGLAAGILGKAASNAMYNDGGVGGIGVLFILFAILGLVPTFIVYKHFWLKVFCSGFSVACFACDMSIFPNAEGVYVVLTTIAFIILLINSVIACFVPNLVIKIKTKSASGAVVIGCQKAMLFRKTGDDYSGFAEVLPWEDTIMAINEVGTIIDDLQKQGDYAVKKWANAEAE